jgi:hypothetical protein
MLLQWKASLYQFCRDKKHGLNHDAINAGAIQSGTRVQIRVKAATKREEDATGMLA